MLLLPAEIFWRIFEKTGSVVAYIMYRKLIIQ
ncbi:MAG TPA: YqzL family protein [Clostridia bacterium]|nr:YqzL family protein [Clostridia bacterium]